MQTIFACRLTGTHQKGDSSLFSFKSARVRCWIQLSARVSKRLMIGLRGSIFWPLPISVDFNLPSLENLELSLSHAYLGLELILRSGKRQHTLFLAQNFNCMILSCNGAHGLRKMKLRFSQLKKLEKSPMNSLIRCIPQYRMNLIWT